MSPIKEISKRESAQSMKAIQQKPSGKYLKKRRESEAAKKQHELNDVKKDIVRRISSGQLSVKKVYRASWAARSTIQGYMKNKEAILEAPDKRKNTIFTHQFKKLEDIVIEFLSRARGCGTAVTGPMLRTLALGMAKKLNINNFTANGFKRSG